MGEIKPVSHVKTAAIIGSFRQHYSEISEVWRIFTGNGLEVTSPKGTPILKEGVPFVRFASDCPTWSDSLIQSVALHRILRADFVFVVAPNHYVGRTTCYEIGRIIHARRPLYFSEQPEDLPILVPADHVYSAGKIAKEISHDCFSPKPLYLNSKDKNFAVERELLFGKYMEENEFYDQISL
jgi:hypothetical protein